MTASGKQPRKRVMIECTECGGVGLRYPNDLDSPPCSSCGGSGKMPDFVPLDEEKIRVGEAVLAEQLATFTARNPAPLPEKEPDTVVFYNPNDRVILQTMTRVPSGAVWVLGPSGELTKVGKP